MYMNNNNLPSFDQKYVTSKATSTETPAFVLTSSCSQPGSLPTDRHSISKLVSVPKVAIDQHQRFVASTATPPPPLYEINHHHLSTIEEYQFKAEPVDFNDGSSLDLNWNELNESEGAIIETGDDFDVSLSSLCLLDNISNYPKLDHSGFYSSTFQQAEDLMITNVQLPIASKSLVPTTANNSVTLTTKSEQDYDQTSQHGVGNGDGLLVVGVPDNVLKGDGDEGVGMSDAEVAIDLHQVSESYLARLEQQGESYVLCVVFFHMKLLSNFCLESCS